MMNRICPLGRCLKHTPVSVVRMPSMSDTSSLTPYILFIVEQNSCVYVMGCTICHGSHVCMP